MTRLEQEHWKVVARNLRRIMHEHGKTQADVAKDLGISKATLSSWMNATRTPRMKNIDILCHYFNIRRSDIMGDGADPSEESTPPIRVPVLGYVAAGIPISAIEDILDWEEVSGDTLRGDGLFALKIRGDSMSPRISDGDVIIARAQRDADTGDIVIVQVNGDSATCKRLVKHSTGISLISFNPAYDPINFSRDEIRRLPVTIIGKVIENRQKY